MNDFIELWNSPWRALQHSLASGAPAARAGSVRTRELDIKGATAAPRSWLLRALEGSAAAARAQVLHR